MTTPLLLKNQITEKTLFEDSNMNNSLNLSQTYQQCYISLLENPSLISLNKSKHKKSSPMILYADAHHFPDFFHHNLVSPGRVIKQFKGSNALIRSFYYQLMKLTFEIEVPQVDYVQIVKNVVFNPMKMVEHNETTSPMSGRGYTDQQYKRLFAQFIQIITKQSIPNFELLIMEYSIIDEALLKIFQNILESIIKENSAHLEAYQIFNILADMFQLHYTKFGNCYKFQESDIFIYEEVPQTEYYVAFMNEMAEVSDYSSTHHLEINPRFTKEEELDEFDEKNQTDSDKFESQQNDLKYQLISDKYRYSAKIGQQNHKTNHQITNAASSQNQIKDYRKSADLKRLIRKGTIESEYDGNKSPENLINQQDMNEYFNPSNYIEQSMNEQKQEQKNIQSDDLKINFENVDENQKDFQKQDFQKVNETHVTMKKAEDYIGEQLVETEKYTDQNIDIVYHYAKYNNTDDDLKDTHNSNYINNDSFKNSTNQFQLKTEEDNETYINTPQFNINLETNNKPDQPFNQAIRSYSQYFAEEETHSNLDFHKKLLDFSDAPSRTKQINQRKQIHQNQVNKTSQIKDKTDVSKDDLLRAYNQEYISNSSESALSPSWMKGSGQRQPPPSILNKNVSYSFGSPRNHNQQSHPNESNNVINNNLQIHQKKVTPLNSYISSSYYDTNPNSFNQASNTPKINHESLISNTLKPSSPPSPRLNASQFSQYSQYSSSYSSSNFVTNSHFTTIHSPTTVYPQSTSQSSIINSLKNIPHYEYGSKTSEYDATHARYDATHATNTIGWRREQPEEDMFFKPKQNSFQVNTQNHINSQLPSLKTYTQRQDNQEDTKGTLYREFTDTRVLDCMTSFEKNTVTNIRKRYKGIHKKDFFGF